MYKIIFGVVLVVSSFSVHAENRLSMELEYELLKDCVSKTRYPKIKIQSCACALSETIQPFWGGYKEDEDYHKNEDEFHKKFRANIKKCSK